MHVGLWWMVTNRTNSQTMSKTLPSLMLLQMPHSQQIFCRAFSLPLASRSSSNILSQALSTFWICLVIKYSNANPLSFHRSEWICQIVRKSAITANPDMRIFKNPYRCMLRWSSICDPLWLHAVINSDSRSFERKLHFCRPYLNKEIQPCTCRWLQIFFFCCCFTCHPVFSITWPKSLWNQRSLCSFSGA